MENENFFALLEASIKSQKEFQDKVEARLDTIQNNHLHHMEIDMAAFKVDLSWIKGIMEREEKSNIESMRSGIKNTINTDWLTKVFWLVAGGAIAFLLSNIFNPIISKL